MVACEQPLLGQHSLDVALHTTRMWPDQTANLLATVEEKKCGHTLNAKVHSDVLIFIDIGFHKAYLSLIFSLTQLCQYWFQRVAVGTPTGGELYNHRQIRLQHSGRKI